VRTGDIIRLDAEAGTLDALVPQQEWDARGIDAADLSSNHTGFGRELFAVFRLHVSSAEEGAANFGLPPLEEPSDLLINQPGGNNSEKEFSDEDTVVNNR
jgi:phosphogluconate dehydratase